MPLAETLLAAKLLSASGLQVPTGPIALALSLASDRPKLASDRPKLAGGRLDGRVAGVAFARECEHLVVMADGPEGPEVALVARADCELEAVEAISRESKDDVNFAATPVVASTEAGLCGGAMKRLGAVVRATQMTGALEAMLDISVDYAQERVAFGRPIGKFQAVQHLLARLAEETAAAVAASGSAAYAMETQPLDGDEAFIEVAAAKVRVGEAAREGAMIAHQVHGAIAFTAEYPLHRYVQRLWGWRDDFGPEAHWALSLGRHVAARGAGDFWPLIVAV